MSAGGNGGQKLTPAAEATEMNPPLQSASQTIDVSIIQASAGCLLILRYCHIVVCSSSRCAHGCSQEITVNFYAGVCAAAESHLGLHGRNSLYCPKAEGISIQEQTETRCAGTKMENAGSGHARKPTGKPLLLHISGVSLPLRGPSGHVRTRLKGKPKIITLLVHTSSFQSLPAAG